MEDDEKGNTLRIIVYIASVGGLQRFRSRERERVKSRGAHAPSIQTCSLPRMGSSCSRTRDMKRTTVTSVACASLLAGGLPLVAADTKLSSKVSSRDGISVVFFREPDMRTEGGSNR